MGILHGRCILEYWHFALNDLVIILAELALSVYIGSLLLHHRKLTLIKLVLTVLLEYQLQSVTCIK